MLSHHAAMPRRQAAPPAGRPRRPTHLAAWRAYRGGMTQEKLAELSGLSESAISQIENGKQWYSPKSIEALARALKCSPGELLSPPGENTDLLGVWTALNRRDKERAMRMLTDWAGEKA